ncbi:MAG: sel1 repeat family protein [Anaerolineae bacterium]|nr:sel1 repeat family protein [Anaerolineae bacterium]
MPDNASADLQALHAAAATNPEARFALALAYRTGIGAPADNGLALVWLKHAAQADYAPAQYQLGSYYTLPEGGENYKVAVQWLRYAADQQHPPAYLSLGQLYALGHGVKRDITTVYALVSLAVDASVEGAQEIKNALMERMTLEEFEQGTKRYFILKKELTAKNVTGFANSILLAK